MKKAWAVFTAVVLSVVIGGVAWALTNDDDTLPRTPNEEPLAAVGHMPAPAPTAPASGDDYASFSAIAEPSPPDWADEQADGSFDCRYGGQELSERKNVLPNGDVVWHVVGDEGVTFIDFKDGTDSIAGVIVGDREFAAIRSEMRPFGYITLQVSVKHFEHYDQPVTVCTVEPIPE